MSAEIYNKLLKPLITYGASNGINLVLPFILLPIFTSILTQTDYGIVANTLIFFQVSAITISLGSNASVTRTYWDRETVDLGKYIYTSICLNFFNFSLLLICASLFYLATKFEYFSLILLILISGLLVTLKDYKFKIWNLENASLKYSIFQSTFTITNLLLALFLVYFIFPDWKSRVYSLFAAQLLFCMISLYRLFKENNILPEFNIEYLKDNFSYGFPLFFHGLGVVLLSSADKVVVTGLIDLSSAGLLAVAAVIASLMTLPTVTMDLAINPIINKYLKENTEESLKNFSKYFSFNILILIGSGLILHFFTPFIFSIFIGSEFQSAQSLVPYLIIGQVFYGLYRFFARPIFFSKKTHLVTLCSISAGLLGLLSQFFLIKNYGLIGACIGNAFGYFLFFLFSLIISKRLYKFKLIRI